MSQPPGTEPSGLAAGHAGAGLRVWGCCLALFALGVGAFGLPEECRLIGYLAAGLFVPAGGFLVFVSLRGRRSDLHGLTGRDAVDVAANAAAGQVFGEVIEKMM